MQRQDWDKIIAIPRISVIMPSPDNYDCKRRSQFLANQLSALWMCIMVPAQTFLSNTVFLRFHKSCNAFTTFTALLKHSNVCFHCYIIWFQLFITISALACISNHSNHYNWKKHVFSRVWNSCLYIWILTFLINIFKNNCLIWIFMKIYIYYHF